MGICGSCGMTVNGEPEADLRDVPRRLRPGPGPRRAAAQLPGHPRSRRRHRRLHARSCRSVKPWLIRDEDERPSRTASTCRRRASSTSTSSSACASTACCATRPARSTALDPDFLGPAAIALAQRYNLDSRDEGARRADGRARPPPTGVWACTFVGECTTACPKDVDPAGAIQRYKLTAATESLKVVPAATGGGDERQRRPSCASPLVPPPHAGAVVGEAPLLPPLRRCAS